MRTIPRFLKPLDNNGLKPVSVGEFKEMFDRMVSKCVNLKGKWMCNG